MPLCTDGRRWCIKEVPPHAEEKNTKWVLRMACGWVSLCAVNSLHLSALDVPSMISYNCQDPRTEAGCWMVPNHKSYSKNCRKGGSVPPVSAFGPCWHGRRSTLGPLFCGWSFLDQKVELLMNVGSIQQKIEFNQWLIHIHSLQGIAEGYFKGTGDEQDVISTFKRCRSFKE